MAVACLTNRIVVVRRKPRTFSFTATGHNVALTLVSATLWKPARRGFPKVGRPPEVIVALSDSDPCAARPC